MMYYKDLNLKETIGDDKKGYSILNLLSEEFLEIIENKFEEKIKNGETKIKESFLTDLIISRLNRILPENFCIFDTEINLEISTTNTVYTPNFNGIVEIPNLYRIVIFLNTTESGSILRICNLLDMKYLDIIPIRGKAIIFDYTMTVMEIENNTTKKYLIFDIEYKEKKITCDICIDNKNYLSDIHCSNNCKINICLVCFTKIESCPLCRKSYIDNSQEYYNESDDEESYHDNYSEDNYSEDGTQQLQEPIDEVQIRTFLNNNGRRIILEESRLDISENNITEESVIRSRDFVTTILCNNDSKREELMESIRNFCR